MIRRTSWPRSSSAAACNSACSTTAPQNDHENGTTIPIFIRGSLTVGRYAGAIRLDGIHHVTCITGDAPRNVDFYTRVLGLRLVKKTVNQDDPTVYHLFYADEAGTPGSDITFFEYPGVRRGQRGRRDGAHRRLARRLGGIAGLLGASPLCRVRSHPRRFGCRLPRPRGAPPPPRGLVGRRRAAPRRAPGGPGRARAAGLRRGARVLCSARRRAGRCSRRHWGSCPTGTDTWEARGPTRGGVYALRRAADRARARRRRDRASRRVVVVARGARGVARASRSRGHAPVADHRPLLVPLDLLPRAERRPLRDRDRSAPASRSTRTPSTSASRSSSRLRSSTCAPRSSRY